MKKGQEGPGLLVTLIVAVLVLAILGGFYIALRTFVSAGSNIEAMRTWVELRGATGATDIAVSAVPPVTDLEKPLKIKSQEELVWKGGKPPEAYKEIADSMVDCWNAFNNGETDFLNSIKKETFCFPCRAVTFSDEIKKNNLKISGLNKYLNEQHVRGENSPTYLQILANDKTYVLWSDGQFYLETNKPATGNGNQVGSAFSSADLTKIITARNYCTCPLL